MHNQLSRGLRLRQYCRVSSRESEGTGFLAGCHLFGVVMKYSVLLSGKNRLQVFGKKIVEEDRLSIVKIEKSEARERELLHYQKLLVAEWLAGCLHS